MVRLDNLSRSRRNRLRSLQAARSESRRIERPERRVRQPDSGAQERRHAPETTLFPAVIVLRRASSAQPPLALPPQSQATMPSAGALSMRTPGSADRTPTAERGDRLPTPRVSAKFEQLPSKE